MEAYLGVRSWCDSDPDKREGVGLCEEPWSRSWSLYTAKYKKLTRALHEVNMRGWSTSRGILRWSMEVAAASNNHLALRKRQGPAGVYFSVPGAHGFNADRGNKLFPTHGQRAGGSCHSEWQNGTARTHQQRAKNMPHYNTWRRNFDQNNAWFCVFTRVDTLSAQ